MNRRGFLKSVVILTGGVLSLENWPAVAGSDPQLNRFDYAALKGYARSRAEQSYKPPDKEAATGSGAFV